MSHSAPFTAPDLTARQVAAQRRFVSDLQRLNLEARPAPPAPRPTDRLRIRAHAAFYEVVTGGDRALDAALDLYAAEVDQLRDRLGEQSEVLKLIRSYSAEQWLRNLTAAVLSPGKSDPRQHLPQTLFDPALALRADGEGRQ
jgi:hypothetical protein